ncbi:UHRF1-binding protein 1-like isoform X2 [Aricia agestis]|uniref:UHRF1-binding protein 1-like isoform X2 n=1 Tax=Aricia agestis TaxID=91739 RepID=UPI001C2051C4|nr:UHRF1-binding protein 1-like isoform X2 [Aricia agestis]
MVTIIKNQLLKHLSRYTKNLSPEQISLSALRGSGELQDLTLEEDLLTELLELPGWVRLTSAKCNRASFRIQWTKLKTVPIVLNLDEVHIALEVCEEPRPLSQNAGAAAMGGKYSYIHKVIDGISVAVNLVQIDFRCDAFTSSVQISRVTVESRTPDGRKGDLRLTRIKSPDTGQLLIFKELEWQSARIEAKAQGAAAANLPPLRLLLGNTHCRIVIKKRLSDCAVVGSRLAVRPEPLAWALTDGQLRAALACAAALAGPVRRATDQATRAKAARKIEEPREQIQTRGGGSERDILARMFAKHDVYETSYHLLAPRIDLHLCDDPGLGRSEMPCLAGGGALQVTLLGMQADLFPYHRAAGDRRHWKGYREAATPHSQWLSQALSSFCADLLDTLDPRPITPVNKVPPPMGNGDTNVSNGSKPSVPNNNSASNAPSTTPTSQASPTRTRILQQLGKLMTTCLVLRIDDFTVNKVSTGSRSREAPRPLVSAERATLPGDAGLLHAELTFFYYPGDVCFPVPAPKLYVQVSPVRVCVDVPSVTWLCAFLPHVAAALPDDPSDSATYVDVRAEAIMPKIVLEAGPEHVSQQRDRPKELHICSARATLTNVRESARSTGAGTRADLAAIISAVRRGAPAAGQFPSAPDDLDPLHEQFLLHADQLDDIDRGTATHGSLLWREARGVWCARAEPLWADFCGARATNYKPSPLLDATPFTAWICFENGFDRIWALCRAGGLCGVQVNHYQLLFLLRQLERVSELAAWLSHQAARMPGADQGSLVAAVVVPSVELTLVLPTSCPGQESSRDVDSVPSVPLDTSSLQDLRIGSESTMAPSMLERDSGLLATQASVDIFSAPPLPAEEVAPPSPGLNFGGLTSVRRGLSSLAASLDAALTRDERSDAASTASSDSDRYVVVGLAAESPDLADLAFHEFEHGRAASVGVEMAAEVVERSSSPSEHSLTSSCKRRDLISTCTFRLSNIHLVQQSTTGRSVMRLVADDVAIDECPAIPWDEFQNKFSMRARAWSEPSTDEYERRKIEPKIAVKLARNELPRILNEKGEPTGLAPFEELMEARLRDLSLDLNMSTALALSEFIEDEVILPPMPLDVLIENMRLHLIEDRAPRSISSPPPQPLDLDLTTLKLRRADDGVIHLGPPQVTPTTPDVNHQAAQEVERLARENEELRKRMVTLSRIAEDNRDLRAKVEEASVLRQCVHAAQQEAAALLADKHQLLETVRLLQEQISGGCRGKR